jgi:2,4-dienoyl-CoA reductase (NADPH2)
MYEHLLSPGRIGSLEIRNRIQMAPMGSNLGEAGGHIGERCLRYYEARARGGVGLITVETTAVAYPEGATGPHQPGISDNAFLPGLQRLTEAIHAHGARCAIQLTHHGKTANLDVLEGRPLLMPSKPHFNGANDLFAALTAEEVQAFPGTGVPHPGVREASHDDIARVVQAFGAAAARARRAGFDAVELHGAHGYLISEFLSPAWNAREDEYGGPLENRARLLQEVLRAMKTSAGPDFPVWVRLDATEFRTQGGIRFEDALRTAELAEQAGADAIHVSAYGDPTSGVAFTDAPLAHAENAYADYAREIKRRVGVPVIAVGRLELEAADRLIAEGGADFVAMGRKLLADPELPRKLAEGRPADVRPCVYCYVCVSQHFFDRSTYCAVNATTGHEHETELRPAPVARHVLVIGGGPAGMEAARVATLRGHRVTLCERSAQLGGTLRFAGLVYEPNARLLRWLERQVRELGVEVQLSSEMTPAGVEQLGADVVVVATGARRERPAVPGAEAAHVLDGDDLRAMLTGEGRTRGLSVLQRGALRAGRVLGLTANPDRARELSRRWLPLGKRIAIWGGGLVGCEIAEFLAERGRQVWVLEPGEKLATEMSLARRWRALYELQELGVELLPGVRLVRVDERELVFSQGEAAARSLEIDQLILAAGVEPAPGLANALRAAGHAVHEIGDVTGVGYIEGAIRDGFQLGLRL